MERKQLAKESFIRLMFGWFGQNVFMLMGRNIRQFFLRKLLTYYASIFTKPKGREIECCQNISLQKILSLDAFRNRQNEVELSLTERRLRFLQQNVSCGQSAIGKISFARKLTSLLSLKLRLEKQNSYKNTGKPKSLQTTDLPMRQKTFYNCTCSCKETWQEHRNT